MGLRRLPVALLMLTMLVPAAFAGGSEPVLLVPANGPEVPAVSDPVAVLTPFVEEVWVWSGATRTHTVQVPDVDFDRAFMVWESDPVDGNGDPWDRLGMVALQGTEVLRTITPRAHYDITEDITEYASLIRPGEPLDVSVSLSSWAEAGLWASVTILLYADEPTVAAGDARADTVVSPFRFTGVNGNARTGPDVLRSATVTFPASAPSAAVLELFTSGHGGDGEFWYLWVDEDQSLPTFEVLVDGVKVGEVQAMPYVYAFLGFCCGNLWNDYVHTAMWWSAHLALDRAGVNTGNGEVPAYRAELPADVLPLLTGEQDVVVQRTTHGGTWPTSVSFLLWE